MPNSPSSSRWLLQWLPILAMLGVIAHFFWYLNSHAANIPFQDDISDFLLFVLSVEKADSLGNALRTVFEQYNAHRVAATRLLVYAVYLLQGEVNFYSLTLLANAALPLILFLFYLCIKDDEYRWIFLLVATLLLVNLKFYTITFMSQAAFAYYYVFVYAFACIVTLHRVSPLKFALAALLCALSSLTLASGQIAWAIGLASLLHQCLLSGRRSLAYPLVWSLLAFVALTLWNWGMVKGEFQISPEQVRTVLPDYLGDAPLRQTVPRYVIFFLAFTGSALVNFSVLWAALAGGAMLALLVYLSLRCFREDDIRLALCCWFAVGTLAAATMGRALLVAPDAILHARYNFFSVMLLCPLALLTLTRFAVFRSSVAHLAAVLALIYSVWAWHYSHDLLQQELDKLYRDFNGGKYPVAGMVKQADAIVKEATAKGLYHPPCRPFPKCDTVATGAGGPEPPP